MKKAFEAPIPGQSLTGRPKNYPWERPPEITDPEVATQMHLMRLSEPKRLSTLFDALEFGVTDLYTLVKGIMRSAVANGIHTVDVGMIAAPVVHEFVKQAADKAGIEYDDGLDDGTEEQQRKRMRAALMAQKKLQKMDIKPPVPKQEEEPMEETVVEEPPKRRGLMAREDM
jgi:hypothetical protein